eukprot:3084011-Amphidinium_carterae.1
MPKKGKGCEQPVLRAAQHPERRYSLMQPTPWNRFCLTPEKPAGLSLIFVFLSCLQDSPLDPESFKGQPTEVTCDTGVLEQLQK